MPTCKNGKGSYKGTEKSPTGRGFCARHEKIGTKKRGRDKQMWIVRGVKLASGKRSRRWFKVLPPVKKSKRKQLSTKTKVNTKRKKKLLGGETMIEKINSLNTNNYSKNTQDMIKRYTRKLNDGIFDEQDVCNEINKYISTFTKFKKEGLDVSKNLTDFKDLRKLLCHVSHHDKHHNFVRTMDGKSHPIYYAKNEKVHDTLTNAGLDNINKLVISGEAVYNSKNKNLTWTQVENRAGKKLIKIECIHAI